LNPPLLAGQLGIPEARRRERSFRRHPPAPSGTVRSPLGGLAL